MGSIFGLPASPPERIVGGTLGKPEKWFVSKEIYIEIGTFWTRLHFRDFGRFVCQHTCTTGAWQQCPQHGKHHLNRGVHDVAERTVCDNMRCRTTETPSKLRNQ